MTGFTLVQLFGDLFCFFTQNRIFFFLLASNLISEYQAHLVEYLTRDKRGGRFKTKIGMWLYPQASGIGRTLCPQARHCILIIALYWFNPEKCSKIKTGFPQKFKNTIL